MLVTLREQRVLKLFSLSSLSLMIFFGCFVLFCFFFHFCHVYKRVLERIKSKRWEDGFIILLTLFYLVKPFDAQTKFVILLTVNHTILMMFVQRIEFWIN